MIYKVENKINGKAYIGQTVGKFKNRKTRHFKDAFNDSDLPFHRAIRKYGEGNFNWEVFEECNTIDELNEREEYWIRELNTISPYGYNLRYGGMNSLWSEDLKVKVGESRRGENNFFYGKNHTEETKVKMRKAKEGKKLSEEHKKNVAKAKRGIKFSESHKYKLSIPKRGEYNHRSKLKEKDIVEIRELYKQGLTQQHISDLKNISRRHIGRIINYERWKHV